MECDSVWDLLSVYADGEASSQDAASVEEHVAHCAACAQDLEFMRSTSGALQSTPDVEPPSTLRAAIMAATIDQPSVADRLAAVLRRSLTPAPVRYGSLAAAGAAAAFALVGMHHGEGVLPTPVAYSPGASPMSGLPVQSGVVALGSGGGLRNEPSIVPAAHADRVRPKIHHESRLARTLPADHSNVRIRPVASSGRRTLVASAAQPGSYVPYRAKVVTNPPASEDPTPYVTTDTPDSAGTAPAPVAPVRTTIEAAAPAASATGAGPHTQFIASAAPVTAEQVQTLAALKRALREQTPSWNGAEVRRSLRDKEIRVDVMRSTF